MEKIVYKTPDYIIRARKKAYEKKKQNRKQLQQQGTIFDWTRTEALKRAKKKYYEKTKKLNAIMRQAKENYDCVLGELTQVCVPAQLR